MMRIGIPLHYYYTKNSNIFISTMVLFPDEKKYMHISNYVKAYNIFEWLLHIVSIVLHIAILLFLVLLCGSDEEKKMVGKKKNLNVPKRAEK